MPFENFWRGERERRERERQRAAGEGSGDERRERSFGAHREHERDSGSYDSGSYGESRRRASERGWSAGGDYYGDRYRGGTREYESDRGAWSGREDESQQYRGVGPRGYHRSDERIREDLCDALTDDARIDASNMEVTVKECEVTLSGSVSSREQKRRAEDLAECISGVRDVHNQLRVSAEQKTQSAGAASESARPHH